MSDISDHFPVFAVVPHVKPMSPGIRESGSRNMSETNISRLKERLSLIDWSDILQSTDVENSYDSFVDILTRNLDAVMPHRHFTRSNYIKN